MQNTQLLIEKLVYYGKQHLHLGDLDAVYVRNLIMAALKQTEVYGEALTSEQQSHIKQLNVPDELVNEILQIAEKEKLCNEGMEQNFAAYIMALLSPMPEVLYKEFLNIKEKQGIETACLYLYNISIKNNYIQKTAIEKNIFWRANFEDNYIEVTINLSKPEKDNKEIARMLKQPPSSYPKCMLCEENLGFEGNLSKPPRQNLRIIPIEMNKEQWFMQYSPYLYYDEHCIIISATHRPMHVDTSTIKKLMDFVNQFPNYFAGSNASLPIVGGSILSHEHYQGGGHKMPVHYAKERTTYKAKRFEKVKISTLNWYNSVVRISSANENQLLQCVNEVLTGWNIYTDESLGIICKTTEQHNAVTPILRKEGNLYIVDLILRNNRTDEKYPDGIYHAHPQYHNIKKEGIGLIEAMGMFILPGRLLNQTAEISKILTGERVFEDDLSIHKNMVDELVAKYGNSISKANADDAIRKYINNVCKNILINTAVFKPDEKGIAGFDKFIKSLNI